jgi:hypothetical protein
MERQRGERDKRKIELLNCMHFTYAYTKLPLPFHPTFKHISHKTVTLFLPSVYRYIKKVNYLMLATWMNTQLVW